MRRKFERAASAFEWSVIAALLLSSCGVFAVEVPILAESIAVLVVCAFLAYRIYRLVRRMVSRRPAR